MVLRPCIPGQNHHMANRHAAKETGAFLDLFIFVLIAYFQYPTTIPKVAPLSVIGFKGSSALSLRVTVHSATGNTAAKMPFMPSLRQVLPPQMKLPAPHTPNFSLDPACEVSFSELLLSTAPRRYKKGAS